MANGNFGGGDGTESSPFLIEDAADLEQVGLKLREYPYYHFKVVNDIDASSINSFTPIGDLSNGPPFMGVFNMDFFKIKNIAINPNSDYCAFFGVIAGGIVQNVILENVTVISDTPDRYKKVALFAHTLTYGSGPDFTDRDALVERCSVQGKINAKGRAAGFVAVCSGKVKECKSEVEIHAKYASGFVDSIGSGKVVENCYAHAEFHLEPPQGEADYNGCSGFVLGGAGTTKNCYSSFVIKSGHSTERSVVGLLSAYEHEGWVNENSFVDIETGILLDEWAPNTWYWEPFDNYVRGTDGHLYELIKGQDYVDYSQGPPFPPFYAARPIDGARWAEFWRKVDDAVYPYAKTTEQMHTKDTFVGWDFDTIWTIDDGNDYPRFAWEPIKCHAFPLATLKVNVIN